MTILKGYNTFPEHNFSGRFSNKKTLLLHVRRVAGIFINWFYQQIKDQIQFYHKV